jgi:hypothetical protein
MRECRKGIKRKRDFPVCPSHRTGSFRPLPAKTCSSVQEGRCAVGLGQSLPPVPVRSKATVTGHRRFPRCVYSAISRAQLPSGTCSGSPLQKPNPSHAQVLCYNPVLHANLLEQGRLGDGCASMNVYESICPHLGFVFWFAFRVLRYWD